MNMLNIFKRTLILAAGLALAAGAASATYKWVDKDGKVHYSDKPVQGAEKVDLKPLTEIPGIETTPNDLAPAAPAEDNGVVYSGLLITSPQQGETLRGSGTGIVFAAQALPNLGSGDRIEFVLDGKVVPQHMPYVDRGQHSLVARVVGQNGDTKVGSDEVTFAVFQNIAKTPTPAPPKK